jgi:mannose-1-phosphate guanylyltransferase
MLHRFEPEIGNNLDDIAAVLGTPEESAVTKTSFKKIKNSFKEIKFLSIDYVVMERTKNVIVLESTFAWNDVGTWTALDRLYEDQKDSQGNLAVSSQILAIDSAGCTVRCDNPEHLVALIGLQDIVVIQTAEATLIARKDQEESVRRIAELLPVSLNGHRECDTM